MLKVIELFSGIGAQTQALTNAEIEHEVVAICEIDKYAIQSYTLLHGKKYNLGDISQVDVKDVPDCDLLTYSSPCQDFSVAGAQEGGEEGSGTRSSLLWECRRIIEAKRPKYLLMENVKNLIGKKHMPVFQKWLDTLSSLGYKNYWKILNARDYGCAQNRERLFCVSILGDEPFIFPSPIPLTVTLRNYLEPETEALQPFYMNDKPFIPCAPTQGTSGLIQVGNLDMKANEAIKRVYDPDGICPTLTTMTGGHRQPKIYIAGKGVRKLTPKECWKLMGFSDEQFEKVAGKLSNAQLYKQAGNSICVPCLKAIFSALLKGNKNENN